MLHYQKFCDLSNLDDICTTFGRNFEQLVAFGRQIGQLCGVVNQVS